MVVDGSGGVDLRVVHQFVDDGVSGYQVDEFEVGPVGGGASVDHFLVCVELFLVEQAVA